MTWMKTSEECVTRPYFIYWISTSKSMLLGPGMGFNCRTTPGWEETWTQNEMMREMVKCICLNHRVWVILLTHDISIKGASLHIETEPELDFFWNLNYKADGGVAGVRTWISQHVCPQENQFWWKKWDYISASAIATEPQSEIWYSSKAFIIETHT